MSIVFADDWLTVYHGDCRAVMAEMESESVHCVVTSPPYFGLRDYGIAGQLGLEATVEEYVAALVAVFGEVRRVLRKDGTVWLNLGDSYAGSWSGNSMRPEGGSQREGGPGFQPLGIGVPARGGRVPAGLKAKDRVMIPARVALALQADGWWLRDEIVWAKPNPMPSSVQDRTTPAHEMVYLLTKSARYWYDAAAIAEPVESGASDRRKMREGLSRIGGMVLASNDPLLAASGLTNVGRKRSVGGHAATRREASLPGNVSAATERQRVGINGRWDASEDDGSAPLTRNKRSVWTVATEPYPEAHFATFPTRLIEPMILAGCPEGGTVLDPFGGSGTVALVAQRLGRKAVLIDLSAEYVAQAIVRIAGGRSAGDGPALDMPVPFRDDGLWSEVPA